MSTSTLEVLARLAITEWTLMGDPSNETEFLQMFHKVIGVDDTNTSILSNNPADFGVTWSEITSMRATMDAEWVATEYRRLRAPEYPPIGDQLDALWKGGEAASDMLATVQAVKDKYPKP